jgi:formamidopyrimidine-DNA glycosylase
MPEGLEAEIHRRAAEVLVRRRINVADVDPACGDPRIISSLVGARVLGVGRAGKHVIVRTTAGDLGLHFGMTGRLIVDGVPAMGDLEYGSNRDDPAWDRFTLTAGRVTVRVNDPRRWSRYVLDPDVSALGVDLLAPETHLAAALQSVRRRRAPVKAVLLDQSVIAGIGNLIADEVLFTAGIDPRTPFADLDDELRERLLAALVRRPAEMLAAGGSHTGVLGPPVRRPSGCCPLDGSPLERATVGGRTTFICPVHQPSGRSA